MDSKVKERIIGAAVLVALGVWLIPWVLNGSDPDEPGLAPVADSELLPAAGTSTVRTETVELDQSPPRLEEPEPVLPLPVAVVASPASDPQRRPGGRMDVGRAPGAAGP